MSTSIGKPGDRINVRICAVREVDMGSKPSFFSISVADDMEAGFTRIPAQDKDLISITFKSEVWNELKKLITSKTKTSFTSKKDKNGKSFLASSKTVQLTIELTMPIKVEALRGKTDAFSIYGNVVKINSREKREGNGIKLEA
jgi:hypothetical protein